MDSWVNLPTPGILHWNSWWMDRNSSKYGSCLRFWPIPTGGVPQMGISQNGWFIREDPSMNGWWLGVTPFRKAPYIISFSRNVLAAVNPLQSWSMILISSKWMEPLPSVSRASKKPLRDFRKESCRVFGATAKTEHWFNLNTISYYIISYYIIWYDIVYVHIFTHDCQWINRPDRAKHASWFCQNTLP